MKKIILILVVLSAFSCKSIKYIPTVTVKDSIVYVNKIKHDSINNFVRDSIYIHQKGDTIFVNKWHYDVKYKELVKNDTINKRIYVDKVVTVVRNELTKFQKILMWLGGILSLALIAFVILKFKKIL